MILGKYRVIDAHCHIYPDKIAEKAVGATDRFYGLSSFGEGTVSHLLAEGERTGVDRFIVQSVASTPHQVRSINEFIAREVMKNPSRLYGLGTLHPDSPDMKGDLRHLLSIGLHGVKLHPDIQDFKIDDARALRIYELCEEIGLPILIHAGDSRYDRSNPNRLLPILEIYTGLTVVAAHLGGWSMWEEAVRLLRGHSNLYVDASSSFAFMSDEKAKEYITAFGTDRVLFGTDYPMWRADTEIDTLLRMHFSDGEYRNIFYNNAVRAFKMS